MYLAAALVLVKVTQYQDVAVVELVPIAAQAETSPYLATRVAGEVTKVVPSIANEISLLNLALVPEGMMQKLLVKVP